LEEKAGWVAEHVCAEAPDRQFVFTIPKRLRTYFRFERRLLGELCWAAARTVITVYRTASGRPDAVGTDPETSKLLLQRSARAAMACTAIDPRGGPEPSASDRGKQPSAAIFAQTGDPARICAETELTSVKAINAAAARAHPGPPKAWAATSPISAFPARLSMGPE
jgi:hypothetical protein